MTNDWIPSIEECNKAYESKCDYPYSDAGIEAIRALIAERYARAAQSAPGAVSRAEVAEPEWVVNNLAELGVKIGERFYFLYKGSSLEYKAGDDDEDDRGYKWRPVWKREFGECCHPLKLERLTEDYDQVDGSRPSDWKPLPLPPEDDEIPPRAEAAPRGTPRLGLEGLRATVQSLLDACEPGTLRMHKLRHERFDNEPGYWLTEEYVEFLCARWQETHHDLAMSAAAPRAPEPEAGDKSVETMCSLPSSLTEHVCGAMPASRKIKHYWRVECACGLETAKCSTEAMAVQVWATANPSRPATPSSFGERLTKLAEMEEKATPGPWLTNKGYVGDRLIGGTDRISIVNSKAYAKFDRVADAELCVALRNSWPEIRAALSLPRAPAKETSAADFAWIIETAGPVYWTGQLTGCHKWSPRSHDAVRFSRQCDAESVIAWVLTTTSPKPKAIEHGWDTERTSPRSAVEAEVVERVDWLARYGHLADAVGRGYRSDMLHAYLVTDQIVELAMTPDERSAWKSALARAQEGRGT